MDSNPEFQVQAYPEPQRTPLHRKSRKINPRKVKELVNAGVTVTDIAKHQGVALSTVWRFLSKTNIQTKSIEYYRQHRSQALALTQCNALEVKNRILESVLDEPLDNIKAIPWSLKASMLTAANNSFGTTYDKERLEQGLSTQNIAYADMIQAMKRLEDEEAKLKAESTSGG